MTSEKVDKLVIRQQAEIISNLRAEIDSLTSRVGGQLASVVNLHEVLNQQPVEPLNLDDFLDDNTTFNFRLNAALKREFSEVCKRQHLTVASALKRYMTDCVRSRYLK